MLAFSASRHQPVFAQHAQLLRQRGLNDPEFGFELTHARLTLREPAKKQQPIGVGQGLEQTTGRISGLPKIVQQEGVSRGHTNTILINILFVNIIFLCIMFDSVVSPTATHHSSSPFHGATLMNPEVHGIFDPATWTVTYVAYDRPGGTAIIIDSVLDYDPKSGRTKTDSAQKVVEFINKQRLTVSLILETHAHADHLSAAPWLRDQLGGQIAIGTDIRAVQGVFKSIFNLDKEFRTDGSQFDRLLEDREQFRVGDLTGEAISVPGHTPACMAYKIGDAVFVGDTLFMPDVGTARCDFPGGDAHTLYRSVRKLLSLPPETRLFMCHDYPPNGRAVRFESTVAEQRAANIHINERISEDEFVSMRTRRDATLDMPVLILPAVQVNIRAGVMPPAESNGVSYLKIPVNAL